MNEDLRRRHVRNPIIDLGFYAACFLIGTPRCCSAGIRDRVRRTGPAIEKIK